MTLVAHPTPKPSRSRYPGKPVATKRRARGKSCHKIVPLTFKLRQSTNEELPGTQFTVLNWLHWKKRCWRWSRSSEPVPQQRPEQPPALPHTLLCPVPHLPTKVYKSVWTFALLLSAVVPQREEQH